MNASDDQTAPLGEAPDVPAITTYASERAASGMLLLNEAIAMVGISAAHPGAHLVQRLRDSAEKIARQGLALDRIRKLHRPAHPTEHRCQECRQFAPCATARAITEAGA